MALLYLLLVPITLLMPVPPGRHAAAPLPRRRRRRGDSPRAAGAEARADRSRLGVAVLVDIAEARMWNCPGCGGTFPGPAWPHDCRGDQPPKGFDELFQRRRIVHPAYEQWEQERAAPPPHGDGLDELRADLAPLVREAIAARPELAHREVTR